MASLSPLAVTQSRTLRAIAAGGHASLTALAEASGQDPRHMNRSLSSLGAEDLIAIAEGGKSHEASLTDAGREQLAMLDRAEGATPPGHVWLRHDQIAPEHNARTDSGLSDGEIAEMADSIASRGLLQKPTVRPFDGHAYPLAFGERRWRGWGVLIERGVWTPDHVELCRIEEGDDKSVRLAQLVENAQRSDLTQLEYGEDFLALAEEHGLTPAQIAEQIGKGAEKGKRFVQIAMKVAREASDENKAKFKESARRATAGEKDDAPFTWTDLRDSVSERKVRFSLDLTPKLAMTLLEVVDAAERFPVEFRGEPGYVRLASPPTGGALSTLWETRKLINIRVNDGAAFAKPMIHSTPSLAAYLTEIGFAPGEAASYFRRQCLAKVRKDVVGEMMATALGDGEYVTPELQGVAEAHAARSSPAPQSAGEGDREAVEGARSVPEEQQRQEFLSALADGSDHYSGNQSNEIAPHPAAVQLTAAQVMAVRMPADQQLILAEVAHKISRHPISPPGRGYTGCEVGAFNQDTRAQQLVLARILQFVPTGSGSKLMAVLTPAAWDVLKAKDWDDPDAATLIEARRSAGQVGWQGDGYVTPWLNAVAAAPAAAAPSPAPQPEHVEGHTEPDAFSRQIADVVAEDTAENLIRNARLGALGVDIGKVLEDLDEAASEAEHVLRTLERWMGCADARKPSRDEVQTALNKIFTAREAAGGLIELHNENQEEAA